MDRPNLTPADLEEVDRVIDLARACENHVDPFRGMSGIKTNALLRAAEILGIDTQHPAEKAQEETEQIQEMKSELE